MENNTNIVEPLFEKLQEYGKTSYELVKLKTLDKTSDIASTLISRLLLAVVILLFVVSINIGVSLWLGDLLGKTYLGFFIVGALYLVIGVILIFIHPSIKNSVNSSIIRQALN